MVITPNIKSLISLPVSVQTIKKYFSYEIWTPNYQKSYLDSKSIKCSLLRLNDKYFFQQNFLQITTQNKYLAHVLQVMTH